MAAKEEFSGVKWLLSSGSFSDLEIHCGTQVFKVHRAILVANSEYFHKLLKSNMTESTACSISFPDEEAHIMARLLEFLYTSNYTTDTDPDVAGYEAKSEVSETGGKRYGLWTRDYDTLDLEVRLFAAADKYGLIKMQDFSTLRFTKAYVKFHQRYKTLPDTTTRDDLDQFSEAVVTLIRAIYASTPNSQKKLRDIVVQTIQRNIELLSVSSRTLSMKNLFSLIAERSDLSHDLITRRLARKSWKCTICDQTTFVLVTFCSDGIWDCKDEVCETATECRNYCGICAEFGKLRRLT